MQHQHTKSTTKSQLAYIKSIISDRYASGWRDISSAMYVISPNGDATDQLKVR